MYTCVVNIHIEAYEIGRAGTVRRVSKARCVRMYVNMYVCMCFIEDLKYIVAGRT